MAVDNRLKARTDMVDLLHMACHRPVDSITTVAEVAAFSARETSETAQHIMIGSRSPL